MSRTPRAPRAKRQFLAFCLELYARCTDDSGHVTRKVFADELLEALATNPDLRDDRELIHRGWQYADDHFTRLEGETGDDAGGGAAQLPLPGDYYRRVPYLVVDDGVRVQTALASLEEEDRWFLIQANENLVSNEAWNRKVREHTALRRAIRPHHQTVGDVLAELTP